MGGCYTDFKILENPENSEVTGYLNFGIFLLPLFGKQKRTGIFDNPFTNTPCYEFFRNPQPFPAGKRHRKKSYEKPD